MTTWEEIWEDEKKIEEELKDFKKELIETTNRAREEGEEKRKKRIRRIFILRLLMEKCKKSAEREDGKMEFDLAKFKQELERQFSQKFASEFTSSTCEFEDKEIITIGIEFKKITGIDFCGIEPEGKKYKCRWEPSDWETSKEENSEQK